MGLFQLGGWKLREFIIEVIICPSLSGKILVDICGPGVIMGVSLLILKIVSVWMRNYIVTLHKMASFSQWHWRGDVDTGLRRMKGIK